MKEACKISTYFCFCSFACERRGCFSDRAIVAPLLCTDSFRNGYVMNLILLSTEKSARRVSTSRS